MPTAKRLVNILEGLFSRFLHRPLAGFADTIEDAARQRLLFGLVAEKCIFERNVLIGGIQAHGLPELIPRGFVLSNLEQRVGEILANGCAVRGQRDALVKARDGLIVVLIA